MDFAAAHVSFVIGAYALSAIALVGLTIQVITRDRALKAELRRLEEHRR
ncbi:MAG: heme exporter protein CcmD [Rhizobiales bacterium]|nr:heme exporter protein CcmD [Hyphomicrobiales bacterium]MBI3674282.1 heme exporter protein CcmD [Hyphomicrobiales bacterium]